MLKSRDLIAIGQTLGEIRIAQYDSVWLARSFSFASLASTSTHQPTTCISTQRRQLTPAFCNADRNNNKRSDQHQSSITNCMLKTNINSSYESAFESISCLKKRVTRRLQRQRNAASILKLAKHSSVSEQQKDESILLAAYGRAATRILPEGTRHKWPLAMTQEPAETKPVFQLFSYFQELVTGLVSSAHNNFGWTKPSGSKDVASRKQILHRNLSSAQEQSSSPSKSSGKPINDEQEKLLLNLNCNKRIKINTCGSLFEQLAKDHPSLYASAPVTKGIDFVVSYYDNLSVLQASSSNQKRTNDSSLLTVCLLHGAPGHYKDFASLINYLTSRNVRIVAPNFPDYSATFDYNFRHSALERACYLQDFFNAINLNAMDMMIGHSSAVYTMFELTSQSLSSSSNRLRIRSLGLLSTPSHQLPGNLAVTPLRMFTLKLFDYPFLRPVLLTLIGVFVKLQGIRNRVDKEKIDDLLIAASAVGYSGHFRMRDQLKLVREFKLPIFMLYGTKDSLIPKHFFDKLKQDIGMTKDEQVKSYRSDGSIERTPTERDDSFVEVVEIASGGHYAFQRYSSQVNKEIYEFLLREVLPRREKELTRL